MKRILIFLLLLSVNAFGAINVLYITHTDTTVGTRNVNVDSIRASIQADLGWTVDLLKSSEAEGKAASFWNTYNLIITWGVEEYTSGSYSAYDADIDQILDTIHKPVICRGAYTADGDPMWLGTATQNVTTSYFRVKSATDFITRKTYTDNYNFGDSVRLYTPSARTTYALRGMANGVRALCGWGGEILSGAADTALVAVVDSGATNANGAAAPHRRGYFAMATEWQYASFAAREMFYRTLRWAVADTVIDTLVTTVRIGREGIDGTWNERGTSATGTDGDMCTETWHYGAYSTIYLGYDAEDRVGLVRARTRAITTMLPDTSTTWAYDITKVTLLMRIGNIAENTPANSFSFWQAAFPVAPDTLWRDQKQTIQLQPGCASYNAGEYHALVNSHYLKYPDIPWDTPYAKTRGVDYGSAPYDSIWLQDPVVDYVMAFDGMETDFATWRADSSANKGVMFHTVGTRTGDAELQCIGEQNAAAFSSVKNGPTFKVDLTWRAANTATEDLDSVIAFAYDSLVFVATEGQANPATQVQTVSNGASAAVFTCSAPTESPSASWLTNTVYGGGYTTFYIGHAVDIAGLAAGYYSTTISNACTGATNTPGTYKVVLWVYSATQAQRPAGGAIIIR